MNKFKFLSRNQIARLPGELGVYTFKKGQEFLYIGKAANIKERVKSHFLQPKFRDDLFLNEVKKVGFIKTDSEIEALILEAKLIKKYQPKYNVVWRDDKNYFYIGFTKEDFPRIFLTHQPKLQTKNYKLKTNFIGPFVDGKSLKQTLKVLRKVFPYRSCKILPKRPCLWYQLDRCPAPCLAESKLGEQIPNARISIRKECRKNIKNILKVLQGKKKQVLADLKKEMKKASLSKNFEKAAKIRDQVAALEKVFAHTRIFEHQMFQVINWIKIQKILKKILKTKKRISRIEAYDVSNIQGQEATGSMVTFINGLPDKNFYRRFKIKISGQPNDTAMVKEILSRRLQHTEWPHPDLILIDGGKPQLNVAVNSKSQIPNPAPERSSVLDQSETLTKFLVRGSKQIKVVALAKKKNKLFVENQKNPILLKTLSREVSDLILQLRDEAHRFAIKYHHKLRARSLTG